MQNITPNFVYNINITCNVMCEHLHRYLDIPKRCQNPCTIIWFIWFYTCLAELYSCHMRFLTVIYGKYI